MHQSGGAVTTQKKLIIFGERKLEGETPRGSAAKWATVEQKRVWGVRDWLHSWKDGTIWGVKREGGSSTKIFQSQTAPVYIHLRNAKPFPASCFKKIDIWVLNIIAVRIILTPITAQILFLGFHVRLFKPYEISNIWLLQSIKMAISDEFYLVSTV